VRCAYIVQSPPQMHRHYARCTPPAPPLCALHLHTARAACPAPCPDFFVPCTHSLSARVRRGRAHLPPFWKKSWFRTKYVDSAQIRCNISSPPVCLENSSGDLKLYRKMTEIAVLAGCAGALRVCCGCAAGALPSAHAWHCKFGK